MSKPYRSGAAKRKIIAEAAKNAEKLPKLTSFFSTTQASCTSTVLSPTVPTEQGSSRLNTNDGEILVTSVIKTEVTEPVF